MQSETFYMTDEASGLEVAITITDDGSGTLRFDIEVLTETGTIGDLNAIYFDLANNGETVDFTVTGDDVTGTAFKEGGVTKVDNFTNMNGEVINELDRFDGGVQFGTQGISRDDIQSTTFTISSNDPEYTLSLSEFSEQDFGLRLTSVGDVDGSRDGSLKLGETAPDFPDGPPPPPPGPVCDDFLFVNEDETFKPFFDPTPGLDTLASGEGSVLANDGGSTSVTMVNGVAIDPSQVQVIEGSNGGYLIMNADGTFDFSTLRDPFDNTEVNAFAGLATGETAMTEFVYTTNDGLEKILCVTINGLDDGGGGGGTGGF